MPSTTSAFTSSDSRTNNSHVLTRATCVLVPSSIMISLMMSSSTNRFDQLVNLTRFESLAKKKCEKENALTNWTFDFDQKVNIFKKGLSYSIFCVHSDFGIRFFIRDSKIVQTVQFPESWLLHKSGPKVKIFKNLSCPIFCIDSNF